MALAMGRTCATPAATNTVAPPEFSRRKSDLVDGDFQHEGSVFVSTINKKGCFIIHPDWVSEEVTKPPPRPVKTAGDNTGIQRAHYIIAPDWVSEGNRFPRFEPGRSHRPWAFEFKGARRWPDQSLDRRPPTVRSSWGGENNPSRPPTGLHVTEHSSGWMPITARSARQVALPSYSYNRNYVTSYGEHYNKTADGILPEAGKGAPGAAPWRSYNSWNVYSQELSRTRRDVPPRPSYMLPSKSSWVP